MTELKKKTKKLNRELQHHGWSSRKKNQWTWNQIIWSYLVRGTKRKSNEGEWRKPPGLTGTTKESLKNVGVQKLQRRRKSWRSYSKKQWESFPNRGQKTNNRIHEAQITPARLNMERSLPRYILFMLPKVNNRDNKAWREEGFVTYTRLSVYFSEVLWDLRECDDVLQVLKQQQQLNEQII